MPFIINFGDIDIKSLPEVGGKNASLGEMISHLSSVGIKVPKGFATTSEAYRTFFFSNSLENEIYPLLKNLDPNDLNQLKEVSHRSQNAILKSHFSKEFVFEITNAYQQLNLQSDQSVAVRSSATAEDLTDAFFAGQQETYLNVSGIEIKK